MTHNARSKLAPYLVVGPFAIVLAFPFYWMLWTALKTDADLYNVENVPFKWEHGSPTTRNFTFLFTDTQYATWLQNTLLVGVVVVVITLALALPAGYALARLSGGVGQSLGVGIFLTYLVPPTLLFIPLFWVISEAHLQNTIWSLVIVLPTISIPFAVWLLMGFFKNVPREIEEAALVDGCSRAQAVFRVVLPISKAGLSAAGMFAFAISLQAFLYPLVFTSSTSVKPVTLGVVTDLIRGDIYYWGELMAGALIAGLPVAILFNVFLDDFVEGITGGAFK